MCPTFPGCGAEEMKAGEALSKENWAQPPVEKREELTTENVDVKRGWEQRPEIEKREAWINPIVAGGVSIGAGPECSIYTCDMCPDHPGCEDEGLSEPPKVVKG